MHGSQIMGTFAPTKDISVNMEYSKTIYHVAEMDCPSEERLIRMKLQDFGNDITALDFDLKGRMLTVIHNAERLSEITSALESLDLGASLKDSGISDTNASDESNDSQQRSILVKVLIVNALFFIFEMTTGIISRSMGLVADSLDMLADASVYGLSLLAVGATVVRKKRVALWSGLVQMVLAVSGIVEVVRRFLLPEFTPVFSIMIWMSALALIANAYCLWLLEQSRSKDAHIQASVIFSANDVIINLGVIISGLAVWYFESRLPDLIVGAIVFLIVIRGAIRILKLSR